MYVYGFIGCQKVQSIKCFLVNFIIVYWIMLCSCYLDDCFLHYTGVFFMILVVWLSTGIFWWLFDTPCHAFLVLMIYWLYTSCLIAYYIIFFHNGYDIVYYIILFINFVGDCLLQWTYSYILWTIFRSEKVSLLVMWSTIWSRCFCFLLFVWTDVWLSIVFMLRRCST